MSFPQQSLKLAISKHISVKFWKTWSEPFVLGHRCLKVLSWPTTCRTQNCELAIPVFCVQCLGHSKFANLAYLCLHLRGTLFAIVGFPVSANPISSYCISRCNYIAEQCFFWVFSQKRNDEMLATQIFCQLIFLAILNFLRTKCI